jgi:hypothetical protein
MIYLWKIKYEPFIHRCQTLPFYMIITLTWISIRKLFVDGSSCICHWRWRSTVIHSVYTFFSLYFAQHTVNGSYMQQQGVGTYCVRGRANSSQASRLIWRARWWQLVQRRPWYTQSLKPTGPRGSPDPRSGPSLASGDGASRVRRCCGV